VSTLAALLCLLAMGIALLLIPLGVPGVWIMGAVLGVAALLGGVEAWVPVVAFGLAGLGEVGELLLLQWSARRNRGSSRAFWGALAGGLAGLLVGLPVPLVGSLLAGVAGTFLGAALVAYAETREAGGAARVGWDVLVGRAGAAVLKVGAGVVVLALGAVRLLAGG